MTRFPPDMVASTTLLESATRSIDPDSEIVWVGIFAVAEVTSRSLPEIGRRFGNRDHTTVIHAVRKVEELRSKDLSFDEDVQLLIRMLES